MDDPSPALYLAIVVLLLLSAFFSCSETALSTVNKIRVRKKAEEGNKKAKSVIKLIDNYDKTLFTILIGNNVVNLTASSIATVIATDLFGFGAAAAATGIITLMVITFGEILPKSYGADNSEKMAFAVVGIMQFFCVILTPFTWFFLKLKNLVSKNQNNGPSVTEDELIYMLDSIEEEGVIEEQERDLVQSALEFDESTIQEILTPRVDIVALDIKSDNECIKNTIIQEGYSRIPIYQESIDNIVGILRSREYLTAIINGEDLDITKMISPPVFVHRTMKLSHLLAKLKATNTHMAVVTDDYGGTSGIVTMEDVLEELVGDIWDEDEDILPGMLRISTTCWEVQGSFYAEDMLEIIGGENGVQEYGLEDGDYNTVNGWAGQIFGYIPQVNETIDYKDLKLTVLDMDGHRIQYLRIQRKIQQNNAQDIAQQETSPSEEDGQ